MTTQEPIADIQFCGFNKIARFSRDIIITEKIDGTNAQIYIGENGEFLTGSRTQWITPEKDNYGFSKWAHEHKDELILLGPGRHFGEWWGQGCQRKYGMDRKVWSLFNTTRWCLYNQEPERILTQDPRQEKYQEKLPECCSLVPVLYKGPFDTMMIDTVLWNLKENGSMASPGFMKPEGIVIYHPHGNYFFKKTIENDDIPKGLIK